MTLRSLEQQLESRGYSGETRTAIRNARICIIDDHIEDLRGLTQSLRAEGFTNLVELSGVGSVEDLLGKRFELVILDLTGVAGAISAADGLGVLEHLKNAQPALPVLVVSGTTTRPHLVSVASRADLMREKPVKALELVHDVEQLLRPFKDQDWAALEILKELRRVEGEVNAELSIAKQLKLAWYRRKLTARLTKQRGDAIGTVVSIADLLTGVGGTTLRVVEIAHKLSELRK